MIVYCVPAFHSCHNSVSFGLVMMPAKIPVTIQEVEYCQVVPIVPLSLMAVDTQDPWIPPSKTGGFYHKGTTAFYLINQVELSALVMLLRSNFHLFAD